MSIFERIAEQKIREAMLNGEFDDLPGKGKPLSLEDLSMVPEELRMGYKVLKNAGFVPEEIQFRKEMLRLEDLIACCYDEKERNELKSRWKAKKLRFHMLMEERTGLGGHAYAAYRDKIETKLL